ncbi:hypothetical protein K470DRAFT_143943 [Piedraia hortae CBS 480.64]|uniref:Secreted protein n=1 Tax=Piedraia hortae CBS 480.64 TaxID=1314780 RepID=A0A6A7BSD7_9PEZI|nr:hypothetical protein K470DRAFT_143943 [Piedraia hortae CBS 480.64]
MIVLIGLCVIGGRGAGPYANHMQGFLLCCCSGDETFGIGEELTFQRSLAVCTLSEPILEKIWNQTRDTYWSRIFSVLSLVSSLVWKSNRVLMLSG